MEEDIRQFFIKILNSVSWVLLWAFVTVALGLYNNLLIPEKEWGLPQVLFYVIVITSFVFLIRKLIKLWR